MRNLFNPSHLRNFLEENKIHAKKRFSQNFLIDGNIIRKIVDIAGVTAEDLIIEIGPGPGALTQMLLKSQAEVIAIEKDKILAEQLNKTFSPLYPLSFKLFSEDFLKFPLEKLLQDKGCSFRKAKVVANLPYHITTPILASLLPLFPLVDSLTLMVQKEFAERLVAKEDTSSYSSLSIFAQFYASIEYGFTVKNSCFYPQPSVQSSVVKLTLKRPPQLFSEQSFFQLVRTAFQKRRKMLRVSLKTLFPVSKIEQALLKIEKNPLSRPENLSLEGFLLLFDALYHSS